MPHERLRPGCTAPRPSTNDFAGLVNLFKLGFIESTDEIKAIVKAIRSRHR